MARRCCFLPAMSWWRTELATVSALLGTSRPPWLLCSSEPTTFRIRPAREVAIAITREDRCGDRHPRRAKRQLLRTTARPLMRVDHPRKMPPRYGESGLSKVQIRRPGEAPSEVSERPAAGVDVLSRLTRVACPGVGAFASRVTAGLPAPAGNHRHAAGAAARLRLAAMAHPREWCWAGTG